jgi:hypothetical protein
MYKIKMRNFLRKHIQGKDDIRRLRRDIAPKKKTRSSRIGDKARSGVNSLKRWRAARRGDYLPGAETAAERAERSGVFGGGKRKRRKTRRKPKRTKKTKRRSRRTRRR